MCDPDFGPACDRCGSLLAVHDDTFRGLMCELRFAFAELGRAFVAGFRGEN